MDDHQSLDLRYRPSRFEDVLGQEPIVTFLSRLITRGKVLRNILLHGSHGSGKTTLARIYMKALYCDAPTSTGSPCHTCKSCHKFQEIGIFNWIELNAGQGGGVDTINHYLGMLKGGLSMTSALYKILFIDEARNVTQQGFEALKKTLEEPPKGFLVIFATNDLHAIPAPVQSRFTLLEVSPLEVPTAIELVRRVAEKEHILIEPEAIQPPVGIKGGYARDLLKTPDQLRLSGSVITKATIKVELGIDYEDRLLRFFMALAQRDLNEQVNFVDGWEEPVAFKVQLVQNFLLATYYNEILGTTARIDPIIASIPTVERRKIIHAFRQRLDPHCGDITSFWRAMMNFWHRDESAQTDASLRTSLALFHETVNAYEVPDNPPVRLTTAQTTQTVPALAPTRQGSRFVRKRAGTQTKKIQEDGKVVLGSHDEGSFLKAQHVRQLINAGSFLIQEYGLFLNSEITIWHRLLGIEDPLTAGNRASEFTHGMKEWLRSRGKTLHRMSTLEADERRGLCTRIVAHIPADFADDMHSWVKSWTTRLGTDASDAVTLSIAVPRSRDKQLATHWKYVRSTCASVNPSLRVSAAGAHPLWQLIGLAEGQLRIAGSIGEAKRVNLSQSLGQEAIRRVMNEKLAPLSAFDDRAWDWLARGWEVDEHKHRIATRKERQESEARISHLFPSGNGLNDELLQLKLQELRASWPGDPRERQRHWVGWWR